MFVCDLAACPLGFLLSTGFIGQYMYKTYQPVLKAHSELLFFSLEWYILAVIIITYVVFFSLIYTHTYIYRLFYQQL